MQFRIPITHVHICRKCCHKVQGSWQIWHSSCKPLAMYTYTCGDMPVLILFQSLQCTSPHHFSGWTIMGPCRSAPLSLDEPPNYTIKLRVPVYHKFKFYCYITNKKKKKMFGCMTRQCIVKINNCRSLWGDTVIIIVNVTDIHSKHNKSNSCRVCLHGFCCHDDDSAGGGGGGGGGAPPYMIEKCSPTKLISFKDTTM